MKANELRIGNLVYTNGEEIVIVNEINNDGINGEFDLCWASHFFENKSIQPIPLTEEWLVKFGFDGRKDFKWLGIVGVQLRDGKYYISLKDLSNVLFHSVVEIKCVHQLQNLYFALTGEELTIG